jgi:ubiquinol-cytochrome c reductase cytochrome b subunit
MIIVMVHLMILHKTGSSNPTGTKENIDKMKFSASISNKDTQVATALFMVIMLIATATPLLIGDVENYNQANPLSTPTHIQPEWYFLFAYAILRSIPSKIGGVVALVMSILILAPITLIKKNAKKFKPDIKVKEWTKATTFIILT